LREQLDVGAQPLLPGREVQQLFFSWH
jgi:hypothetical protein